jgi:hypothetical protein
MAEAGYCYAQGVGCKKDLKKAAKFYRDAEAKGMSMVGNSWYVPRDSPPISREQKLTIEFLGSTRPNILTMARHQQRRKRSHAASLGHAISSASRGRTRATRPSRLRRPRVSLRRSSHRLPSLALQVAFRIFMHHEHRIILPPFSGFYITFLAYTAFKAFR